MQQQTAVRVPDDSGHVAERVREVIEWTGCSQREFARRIVMDPSKLSRSLGGSRRFTAAELVRIADAGAVDAGWLLGSRAGASPAPGAGEPSSAVGRSVGAGASAPGTTTSEAATGTAGRPVAGSEGGRPSGPEGGRPLQIVRETVRLIAERGFHAVRVADIATACSTSTAAIHYHFPGRAELLEASVRWCMDEDTALRAAHTERAESAAEELRQLIALQTPRTAQQRRQWLVWLDLWAEAARSTAVGRLHVEYYRQWRTTVADVLRRGIAQGVFREVDPEASALRLTALIDGLASQVLATGEDGGTSAEDMYDALLAHVDTELAVRDADGPAAETASAPGPARNSGVTGAPAGTAT
ncbi:TetR family transcriptional regulator [Streptomyces sp. AJS327]|uniref:TetR/AcrR family transcriptional regulator n=1 Tax=Streptomyces sp. AJS327 TaxID=2545265 RepID=UPI0015DD7BAE|nr:TetR/AcrR family transcriptional regulator [Streptomyces sp. AJS327]MBA0053977.1 TetR family transcriptional regulator [Streptomyces sp. AJS327]